MQCYEILFLSIFNLPAVALFPRWFQHAFWIIQYWERSEQFITECEVSRRRAGRTTGTGDVQTEIHFLSRLSNNFSVSRGVPPANVCTQTIRWRGGGGVGVVFDDVDDDDDDDDDDDGDDSEEE